MFGILMWVMLMGGGGVSSGILGLIGKSFVLNFSFFYIIFYICNLIGKKFLLIVENILFFVTFFIGLVEIFLLINFNTLLNIVFVQIILSSNFNEGNEFIQTYIDGKILIYLIVYCLCSMAFLIKLPKRHIAISVKLSVVFLCLCIGFFMFVYGRYWYGLKLPGKDYFIEKNIVFRWEQVIIQGFKAQNDFMREYNALLNSTKSFKVQKEGEIISNTSEIPNIVLIIGESTQRNYMSLYGYPLNTTPFLKSLQEKGNLYVFNDVISPHAHTDLSLQKVLTFSNYENSDILWFKQQNLINVMRFANYKTYWLSNQETFSIWGNAPEVMSRHADITKFSNISTSYTSGSLFDEVLIQMLDSVMHTNISDDKHFYILHLMGTHGEYCNRYPNKFNKFTHNDILKYQLNTLSSFSTISSTQLTNEQSKIKLDYVNAILYNDYVVNEIIKRFENEDAIIFYFSDHGDEVYDFRDFSGHSNTIASRFMAEIPFMIYVSDTFKQKHADMVKKIDSAKDLPFMTDDFIHAFLDILGIKTKDSIEERSIFNNHYNKNRARIFAGNKDYDKVLKNQVLQGTLPQKFWLHRVDDMKKLAEFYGKYVGYEIDVHFLENNPKRSIPYFDVGHDGLQDSINLDLEQMFEFVYNKNKEQLNKNKKLDVKFWIDFKNLTETNKIKALETMQRLCDKYNIPLNNLIIESTSYEPLGVFKDAGFHTSYYVTYSEKQMQDKENTYKDLHNIANSNNIDYISFDYFQYYNFIKQSSVKLPLLTWKLGSPWFDNVEVDAYKDSQVDVILVSEEGNYR